MHISGGVCLINCKHLCDDIGINCLLICVRDPLHLIDALARVWCDPLNWLIHLDSLDIGIYRTLPLTFDVGQDGKQQELDHSQCPWARRLHNRAKCANSLRGNPSQRWTRDFSHRYACGISVCGFACILNGPPAIRTHPNVNFAGTDICMYTGTLIAIPDPISISISIPTPIPHLRHPPVSWLIDPDTAHECPSCSSNHASHVHFGFRGQK